MDHKQRPVLPRQKSERKKIKILPKVLFSFIIFFLALELFLQSAHLFTGMMTRSDELRTSGPVILCVGDSHTYGLYVPKDKTYPAQLQDLLRRNGIEADVVNMGIPGQNSSQLRQSLPSLMERYGPEIVLVLIGANNGWNKSATLYSDAEDGRLESGFKSFFLKLGYGAYYFLRTPRLVRFLAYETMIDERARATDREGEVHFHRGRLKDNDWEKGGRVFDRSLRDLFAIIDTVRDHDAQPFLLNYPAQPIKNREMENHVIAKAARTRSVPLVNIRDAITLRFWIGGERFDKETRDKYFLDDPEETHLDETGYKIVAEKILGALKRHGTVNKNGLTLPN